MKALPLSRVYRLIEPGPTLLLTTAHRGRANVMALSWHMMVDFTPPTIAVIVSNRNFSFTALTRTRQCVLAIPALPIARKVVQVGNSSARDVPDKFARFGLTPLPARSVAAPLIAECFANLECRVADTRLVNSRCLFILEVLRAWRDPAQRHPLTLHHCGYGRFHLPGKTVSLRSSKP